MKRRKKCRMEVYISLFFITFFLFSCEPQQFHTRLTCKNSTEYIAYFPEGLWDDGSTTLAPGEEKSVDYWGFEEKENMYLPYSIDDETIVITGIYIYADEHVIVTIFAPGQDGFSVEKERL